MQGWQERQQEGTSRHQGQALFRAHAAAVLRGDTAEAARVLEAIRPASWLGHQLFVLALFTSTVTDHFGPDLDRTELDQFTTRLRTAHPGLHWLRAEALIRASYGETSLYLDVPQSEHWTLMWAVLTCLTPPDTQPETLHERFDHADHLGRQIVTDIFATEHLYHQTDQPAPAPETGSETETNSEPETEPKPEPKTESVSEGEAVSVRVRADREEAT